MYIRPAVFMNGQQLPLILQRFPAYDQAYRHDAAYQSAARLASPAYPPASADAAFRLDPPPAQFFLQNCKNGPHFSPHSSSRSAGAVGYLFNRAASRS